MAPGPSMPFEIKYAKASELGALVGIEIRFHTFKTVSSFEYFAKPECHILAGVDSGTGEIIAYSRWNIPSIYQFKRAVHTSLSINAQAQLQNLWAYAPELNKGTYTFYEEMIKRSRNVHLRQTDIGIKKADACNARIYLEATMEEVPAYLKHR
ncbi:uncharacterized protein BO97DRAFT_432934 [Aspergillus homomorphus CBS 101889]|uniref:Uncharacterized protein n=1 Tax=Aspergillus homomorphus (strain CBS 101889) TaxID=1450537 RepID=A0A395I2U0_ASPHC|nr:hypothetical protein BO97DRAFT_432934 [Aspergillus homomorphus CBS 101889]RAL14247.1 hypothetical protein BO97DRAFT_432934 [Aspergillus homomorphus CBS 101889]